MRKSSGMLPTKLPTTKGSILIRDHDMNPLFVLDIWGCTSRDLCMCPGGGNIVADALRRRGIDPESVFFAIWDVVYD